MNIECKNVFKVFGQHWVIQNFSKTFEGGQKYVLLGANGSGKSTLLQLLSGYVSPTKGNISYKEKNDVLISDTIYEKVSFAAAYNDVIENFTLSELINFVSVFKPFNAEVKVQTVPKILELSGREKQFVSNYSSGMQQRVKLGLAILNDAPILLLDEPCTHLDANSKTWYQNMIQTYASEKLIIVASNHQKEEYAFCNIQIENWKIRRNGQNG